MAPSRDRRSTLHAAFPARSSDPSGAMSPVASLPLAAEDRALRAAFRRIVPFLFLCYVVAYIDRVNVGIAGLRMTRDLGLTPSQFGFSAGIFFLGYFIAEVPSNLALQRFGARRWIARILITWGLVSAATVFAQGPVSFAVLRFLLGLGEAGFAPGMLLYLSGWFPAQHRGRAVSGIMLGLPVANIVGAPLSSSLMLLDGLGGLKGWQWLLLIESLPAIILGVTCLLVLSDQPEKAEWLAPDERAGLADRMAAERTAMERRGRTTLLSAFTNWRVFGFSAVAFLAVVGSVGLAIWLPQIVQGLGLGVLDVGLVVALAYMIGGVAILVAGRWSDRVPNRAVIPFVALLVASVGFLLSWLFGHSPVLRVAAFCLAVAGLMAFQGTFWTLPMNMLTGRAAAGGLALVVSIGNLGGFAGPTLIGWVREATGRFDLALILIAGLVLLSAVLLVAVTGPGVLTGRKPSGPG